MVDSDEDQSHMKPNELPPLRQIGAEVGFSLFAADEPPRNPEHFRTYGAMVTNHIQCFFETRLAPDDRALLRSHDSGEDKWTAAIRKRIWGTLDNTIIELAQTLGWRIYLSDVVLLRLAKWQGGHEHGPERFEKLGAAVVLAARVARGQAKLPISESEWKQNKARALAELRNLFLGFRSVFNQRRTAPSYQEACDWLRKTVECSPKTFPFLSINMPSLFRYLELTALEDETIRSRVALGVIRPGKLFDDWGAWSRNLSPDTFRQSISELPLKKV